jgi:DNA-binding phage protein
MNDSNELSNFQEKIDLYLDQALDQGDERQLLETVAEDDNCKQMLHKAQQYRSFIKNNVHRPSVSSEFIRSIKDKIRIV